MKQCSEQEKSALASLSQLWSEADGVADRSARVRLFALAFLGKPYLLGACGEGLQGRYDQFPLFREDAFDCLTYVNTVLALAYAGQEAQILPNLVAVNYLNNSVSYVSRCHYMTSDWLVKNVQDRRLQWITESLGFAVHTATGVLNRKQFFSEKTAQQLRLIESVTDAEKQQRVAELHALDEAEAIPVSITYCHWAELFNSSQQLKAALPAVSLMLVVRPSAAYVQSCGMVTHLGFVLNEENELFFVHAKHNESIQKERLTDYLQRFLDSPSVEGASFLRFE